MHINNDTYGNMSDGYIVAGTTLRRSEANWIYTTILGEFAKPKMAMKIYLPRIHDS